MKATRFDLLAFVAKHGVVLASARGPVPNLAEAVAGEKIRGGWWSHRKGKEIFRALAVVQDSPNVLCLRLIEGKITFVHRRLWPALVRVSSVLGKKRLAAIRQEHTKSGAHRNKIMPFPHWVSPAVSRSAKRLSLAQAKTKLGNWIDF